MSKKIIIGHTAEGKAVAFDVQELTTSNLLLEGATGSGKSYAARKILEELAPLMQCVVIDPDGELVTLREKFPFVLAGEGGEVPMSTGTARVLAERIVEHRFSCICDLSDLKKHERREWLRVFIETLMERPKKTWHQTIVVFIDEAHLFAPEKDQRDKTELAEPVIDLAGRGLKRGLVTIAATQRISKLHKDVVSELQNAMAGRHFLDRDRQRVAETLGVAKGKDTSDFMAEIKVLPRGTFFAIGAAIADERVKFVVDPVKTTHPERGAKRKKLEPPPTPDGLKDVLGAIRDLPAQAEKKAKDEAALRKELGEAQKRIKELERATPSVTRIQADRAAVVREINRELAKQENEFAKREAEYRGFLFRQREQIKSALGKAGIGLADISVLINKTPKLPEFKYEVLRENNLVSEKQANAIHEALDRGAPPPQPQLVNGHRDEPNTPPPDGQSFKSGAKVMLDVLLSWYPHAMSKAQLGTMSGFTAGGSTMREYLRQLRSAGLIEISGNQVKATDRARDEYGSGSKEVPQSTDEVLSLWKPKLKSGAGEILDVLVAASGRPLSPQEIEEGTGGKFVAGGSTMREYTRMLCAVNLAVRANGGIAANKETLFL